MPKEDFAAKRSRYTEEQTAFALKQAELGTPVGEVVRKMWTTEKACYNWKKKYGAASLNSGGLSSLRKKIKTCQQILPLPRGTERIHE